MVSRTIPVEPFDLVIFGATGDLSRRKILPGLYRRMLAGQMPEGARIIGAARSKLSIAQFRKMVQEALETFIGKDSLDGTMAKTFLDCLAYVTVDATGDCVWAERGMILDDAPVHVRAF